MNVPCTATFKNELTNNETLTCTLEAQHRDPEYGTDHAGPNQGPAGRIRWSDSAHGATPHREADEHGQEYQKAVQQALYEASLDGALIFLDQAQKAFHSVRDRELDRMKVLVAASESPAHAVRLAAQYADRAIANGERADAVELQVKQARALEAKWTQIAADNDGAVVSVGVAAGILKATLDGFNDLLAEVEGR